MRPALDFTTLKVFVAVVERESFVGASKALEIPTSNVSRCISQLEEKLNLQLIERSTRHMKLTQAGHLLYTRAKPLLEALEQTETERLIQATASALCAVGFDLGATHVEVIMTPEGPHIVEMAGRPGGARIATDLIPLAYGMDYTEDLLRVALDQPPKRKHSIIAGSAIEWISAPSGKLRRICGLESAASVPGIVDVVVRAYPGMMLHAPVDCVSRDMLGYVLASGQTASDALEACDQACTHIQTLFDY